MIHKTSKFNLKQRDFHSGRMISPPRSEWKTCNCCGRKIVKGVIMSNADHIGEDCHEVVIRVASHKACGFDDSHNESLFKAFGTEKRVQEYAIKAAN